MGKKKKKTITSLSLDKALQKVSVIINKRFKKPNKAQDPDFISAVKQWDEFGGFKGYWVNIEYRNRDILFPPMYILLDITPYYTRVLNTDNLERIPMYTPGVHNYPKKTKHRNILVKGDNKWKVKLK